MGEIHARGVGSRRQACHRRIRIRFRRGTWATNLTWIFLGGEVVVDYSLRLKSELGRGPHVVSGYSNDVMAYIPSRRVLGEGGYEGGLARFPYGLAGPVGWNIEQKIVDKAHKLREGSVSGMNEPIAALHHLIGTR